MAPQAREKISRRGWLMAGFTIPLFRARAAAALTVSSDGDSLYVAAPQLHFLTGRPLVRLMDGNTVVFLSQITLFGDANHMTMIRKQPEQITVSYAIWDEKFKVVLDTVEIAAHTIDRRSAKDLSLSQTETWCMQNLAISALGLEPARPFWLRFELRSANERDLSSVRSEGGISIRGLIEAFSHRAGNDEFHRSLEAGPLRLIDLPRTVIRRTHNG